VNIFVFEEERAYHDVGNGLRNEIRFLHHNSLLQHIHLEGVARVLQSVSQDLYGSVEGRYEGGTRVLPECYKSVTDVFQG
jgi:hypothetical protein